MLNFSEGDTICSVGDPPNGIYLVVKGMVKVHFIPTIPILEVIPYFLHSINIPISVFAPALRATTI